MQYEDKFISLTIPDSIKIKTVSRDEPNTWIIGEDFSLSIQVPDHRTPDMKTYYNWEKEFMHSINSVSFTESNKTEYEDAYIFYDIRETDHKELCNVTLSALYTNFIVNINEEIVCRPVDDINSYDTGPILQLFYSLKINIDAYAEYIREWEEADEKKIVKMGQKKRLALAARYGMPEEAVFQDLPYLIEKYGEDCVREGYLPGETPKKSRAELNEMKSKLLKELDAFVSLPVLDHGYLATSGSRITLFGDRKRWAITFEKCGYANRSQNVQIWIDTYGNCLTNECHTNFITIIEQEEIEKICTFGETILPEENFIVVRSAKLEIQHNPVCYKKEKIELANPPEIDIVEMVRYLNDKNPDLFYATETERRTGLPADLPLIMVIDQWHQPDFNGEESDTTFSDHETFQQIAAVLALGDPKKWKPRKREFNNDWRNWPKAGNM